MNSEPGEDIIYPLLRMNPPRTDVALPLGNICPKVYFTDEKGTELFIALIKIDFIQMDQLSNAPYVGIKGFEKFADSGCTIIFNKNDKDYIAVFGVAREENSPTYRLLCEIKTGSTWQTGKTIFTSERSNLYSAQVEPAIIFQFFRAFSKAEA